jgi:hypothetical protein
MKVLESNSNLLTIGPNHYINFDSYGGADAGDVNRNLIEIHSTESQYHRERQLGIFTKFSPIVSQLEDKTFGKLNKAISELISPYIAQTYTQSQDNLAKIGIEEAAKSLEKFRVELKAFFNVKNVIAAFNTENVNIFDIYIDDVSSLEEPKFDVLDFGPGNDNIITLSNPQETIITVLINQKLIKELISKYILTNKDVFSNTNSFHINANFSNSGELNSALHDVFISCFLGSLILERYREMRVSQYNYTMDYISWGIQQKYHDLFNESAYGLGNRETGKAVLNDIISAKSKDFEKFHLREAASYEYLSPDFHTFNNMLRGISWEKVVNPLLYTKIVTELTEAEVAESLKRLNLLIPIEKFAKLTALTHPSLGNNKNNIIVDTIRSTLAIKRVIPFIYYTTYILNNGSNFKTTETILNEIEGVYDNIRAIASSNVAYSGLFDILNRILDYSKQYKTIFSNPLHTNSNFINFMLASINKDISQVIRG